VSRRYLNVLSDGTMRLALTMEEERIQKLVYMREKEGLGERRSVLSQLSGGQWRRVALSVDLAYAQLARRR
jgi:ABC-type sulfate/molybdate transport systems ATPase subunit